MERLRHSRSECVGLGQCHGNGALLIFPFLVMGRIPRGGARGDSSRAVGISTMQFYYSFGNSNATLRPSSYRPTCDEKGKRKTMRVMALSPGHPGRRNPTRGGGGSISVPSDRQSRDRDSHIPHIPHIPPPLFHLALHANAARPPPAYAIGVNIMTRRFSLTDGHDLETRCVDGANADAAPTRARDRAVDNFMIILYFEDTQMKE